MDEPWTTSDRSARDQHAAAVVEALFASAGWHVHRTSGRQASTAPDLIVRRRGMTYAVEVKTAAEGRSDRLVPLWSQALLQAMHLAGDRHRPLALIAAPKIPPRTADQVLRFAAEYAPDAAVGIVDFAGLRRFRGPGLDGLDADEAERSSDTLSLSTGGTNVFSDLNQWMLKVLLAPELPETLLAAPRGRYRNASELARAARVSVMSAFRFLQQLSRDGYLHESKTHLELVRREALFRHWQASALRRVKEVPMRLLLRKDPKVEIPRLVESGRACLALFAAADALKLGFVRGVPPYVYVKRLTLPSLSAWKHLVPVEPGEVPDVILRQPPAPQSVFRGAVTVERRLVSDVMQVWLDVSSHPSRGQEQADLIRDRILDPIIRGTRGHE